MQSYNLLLLFLKTLLMQKTDFHHLDGADQVMAHLGGWCWLANDNGNICGGEEVFDGD